MLGNTVFTIVHKNLRYVVSTDHLCSFKLWIQVYDGDALKVNIFMWLLDKNGNLLDTIRHYDNKIFPSWKEASGFRWYGLLHDDLFPTEVRKKLDSYFKLKAFW